MTESSIVIRVEGELKAAFADAAKATDHTASQLLRGYMRSYVKKRQKAADYDTWFRSEVESGLRDLDAGRVVSSEEVEGYFAKRRAASLRKASLKKRGAKRR